MIFVVLAAAWGVFNCRVREYWKWIAIAAVWMMAMGLLIPGYGTLDDPRGDGILTRHIRTASNDGQAVGIFAILALILFYGCMIYFLSKAWKFGRAYKASREAGEIEWDDEPGVGRKAFEIAILIILAGLWLTQGGKLLQFGGPEELMVQTPNQRTQVVSEHIPDQVALQVAASVVRINEAPDTVIDKTTKMTHATSEGRTLSYHYEVTVNNLSDEAFLAMAKAKTIPAVCADKAMRRDMDELGVTYRYSYKRPGNPEEISMDVSSSICKQ